MNGERVGTGKASRMVDRIAAVVILALLLLLGAGAMQRRAEHVALAQRELANAGFAAAAATERILGDVEGALLSVVLDLDRDGFQATPGAHDAMLRALAIRHDATRALGLADAEGRVVSASVPRTAEINVADREFFQAHLRDTLVGAFHGAALVARIDGAAVVPVSRAVRGPDGRLAAVAVADVDLASMKEPLARLELGRTGRVELYAPGARLVLAHPDGAPLHADLTGAVLDRGYAESSDGRRLVHVHGVGGSGYVVVVSRLESEVLATWWRSAAAAAGAVGVALIAVAALLLALKRDLKARGAMEVALAKSEERFALAVAATSDGIWDWDLGSGAVYYSPRWKEMLGFRPDELPDAFATWEDRVHPEDLPRARAAIRRHLEEGAEFHVEHRMRHRDGGWRWILSRARAVRGAEGRPLRLVGTHADVTEAKAREAALEATRKRLLDAHRIAQLGNWELDLRTGRLWWSEESFRLVGLEPDPEGWAPAFEHFLVMVPPEDHAALHEALRRSTAGEAERVTVEHRLTRRDGAERILLQRGEVIRDAQGRPVTLTGTTQDVTEARREEMRLRQLALAVEQAPMGMLVTDRQGVIQSVNPAMERMTGYSACELIGRTPRVLKSGCHGTEFYRDFWRRLSSGEGWSGEIVNRRKDGVLYWEELTVTPVRDRAGAVTSYIALKRDVTERKQMLDRIENLAYHDPLSGLANRTLFQQRLDYLQALCQRTGRQAALLYLDLDGFKQVNDGFGHDAGDAVLKIAADRIRGCLRQVDMAARLGGDEFAVALLLDSSETGMAVSVADRILHTLAEPIALAGREVTIGASIGIALHPRCGANIDECLRRADHAMYLAKTGGKNRYEMASAELEPAG